MQGVYPMMYYSHNLHFIAVENATMGDYAASLAAARKLSDHVSPHIDEMPMLDFFASMTPMVMVRFRQWDEILQQPAANPKHVVSAGIWHYARGMAYASKGQVKEAQLEIDGDQATHTRDDQDTDKYCGYRKRRTYSSHVRIHHRSQDCSFAKEEC